MQSRPLEDGDRGIISLSESACKNRPSPKKKTSKQQQKRKNRRGKGGAPIKGAVPVGTELA